MKTQITIPLEMNKTGDIRHEKFSKGDFTSVYLYFTIRTNRRMSKALVNLFSEDKSFRRQMLSYVKKYAAENELWTILTSSNPNTMLRGYWNLYPSGKRLIVTLHLAGYVSSSQILEGWLAEREDLTFLRVG